MAKHQAVAALGIDKRYFFITDQVTNKEIEIIYCATGEMIADLLKKLPRGIQFENLSNNILNIQDGTSVSPEMTMIHRSVLKNGNNCAMTNDDSEEELWAV